MGKTVTLVGAGPGLGRFSGALGEVWTLLNLGMGLSQSRDATLYSEVSALTASHLPVLAYKRSKFLGTPGVQGSETWMLELNSFAHRMIWPHLSEGPAKDIAAKNCVIAMLDDIVSTEQARHAEMHDPENPPYTSRFDTSWAI